MARGRKKKLIKNIPEMNYPLRNRRSSMKVNLSFTSNLSDSVNSTFKGTKIENVKTLTEKSSTRTEDQIPSPPKKSKKPIAPDRAEANTPANLADITVINARERLLARYNKLSQQPEPKTLVDMNEKEQQLQKTCLELKNAIMYKTQAYFDKENELAIKTSEVLDDKHTE